MKHSRYEEIPFDKQWYWVPFDRKIEIVILTLGVILACSVLVTTCRQLGQMREQTKAMQDQLAEMSADTKAIAEAIKAQAEETRNLATATQESLTVTKEQFAEGIRPYVWVKDTGKPHISVGDKASIHIFYTNVGHSPAIVARQKHQMFFGEEAYRIAHGKEVPGFLPKFTSPARRDSGNILPTNMPKYETAWSSETITPADLEYVKTNDFGWLVMGYFEYFDTIGNAYYTKYCRFHWLSGAIGNCPHHNQIQ